jgi:hypothetical protein
MCHMQDTDPLSCKVKVTLRGQMRKRILTTNCRTSIDNLILKRQYVAWWESVSCIKYDRHDQQRIAALNERYSRTTPQDQYPYVQGRLHIKRLLDSNKKILSGIVPCHASSHEMCKALWGQI